MRLNIIRNPIANLKKRFWLRAGVLSFSGAALVIIDEYLKEGYLFNPNDITLIGSHESIVVTLIFFGGLSLFKHGMKVKKNGTGED